MKKLAVIAIVVIAAAAGGYVAFGDRISGSRSGQSAGGDPGPVPISGSVQNFTVLAEPVPAPLIAFETEQGEQKTFEDLQGKLVLVNFWATYCGPCLRELPTIEVLAKEFADDGFAVALMSHDHEGWEKINLYLTRLKIATPQSYLDSGKKLGVVVGVPNLPTSILVDKDGNIVGALPGNAEWDTPEAFELIRYFLNQQAMG